MQPNFMLIKKKNSKHNTDIFSLDSQGCAKSKNFDLTIEFEIFEIGNLEFGTEIGIFDFELCEFGSNSVMEFLKSEFPISISFYNIY